MKYILPKKHRCAQSTLMYVATLVAMVMAIIAMSTYIKRGFQGRYRAVSDELGAQYEPGATTINNITTTTTVSHEYEIPYPSTTNSERTATAVDSTSNVTEDKHEEVARYR
jgi:hypothetical protein